MDLETFLLPGEGCFLSLLLMKARTKRQGPREVESGEKTAWEDGHIVIKLSVNLLRKLTTTKILLGYRFGPQVCVPISHPSFNLYIKILKTPIVWYLFGDGVCKEVRCSEGWNLSLTG